MSKRQVVEELHKPARKNFRRRRVIIKGLDDLWQADLVEMISFAKQNKGYRYILTVIDTFSKYAWVMPIKRKTAQNTTEAMNLIFSASQRYPKNLQTDDGKEFFNKYFKNLMKHYKINHYSTCSVKKASIVERFNRTLKEKMWKEFSYNGNHKWLNIYDKLVNQYNDTKHRTINMKPKNVNKSNESIILSTKYNHIKMFEPYKFNVGDAVRISKYKHIFEKGYTPNWTTEIFNIRKIQNTSPVTYLLQDYKGAPIKGCFYEQELMKTKYDSAYLVEKILKIKNEKMFVKWLGFPTSHNSWVNKTDIII